MYIKIIIALFCCTVGYSQSNISVDYMFYLDTELPKKVPCKLLVEKDSSVFFIDMTKFQKWQDREVVLDENLFDDTSSILQIKHQNKFIKINKQKHTMEMIDNLIFAENYHVIDIYLQNKWVITKETKKISTYQCIKATTNYRGRDWEVWFTTDLVFSFGPWKLHGLPGLILEAKSVDGRFSFVANKIDFNPINLQFPTNDLRKITMKQLIENYESTLRTGSVERDVTIKISPRNSPELIYEWEEETKQ